MWQREPVTIPSEMANMRLILHVSARQSKSRVVIKEEALKLI